MKIFANSRGYLILILGDLIAYIFALVLTLTVRYRQIPSEHLLGSHLTSFSILIAIFILSSFIAGLYDKQVAFIRKHIQGLLFRVQIINILIGALFFYLAPVGIAPKANLIIYFIISTALLFLWRMVMFPVFSIARKQKAILVGSGLDIDDLLEEVNSNDTYGLHCIEQIIPAPDHTKVIDMIKHSVTSNKIDIIVADLGNKEVEAIMPFLYSLVFGGVKIVDASKLYESIFDRVPISVVGERWLVENSSTAFGNRKVYDGLKRLFDIVLASIGAIISLIFYPFVYFAIKLDDKGSIFITQTRIGMNGKAVKIIKFRSMSGNDNGKYNKDGTSNLRITRVGRILRVTRIDELPQLWNVIKGDLSLVGPRPELPRLVEVYDKEIPYYNARHLVKPGLFGWAQIYHQAHPHHAVATEDTRDKLSYDLYYVKNRSLVLDLRIILRTINILLKTAGK